MKDYVGMKGNSNNMNINININSSKKNINININININRSSDDSISDNVTITTMKRSSFNNNAFQRCKNGIKMP